jgi:hypothetical protein
VNQGDASALAESGTHFLAPGGERAFGKPREVDLVLNQVGNTSLSMVNNSIVRATMLYYH